MSGALDRETTPIQTLILQASDTTYTSTSELIIAILDVNDEPPKFTQSFYSLSISESASPGDPVGLIKAVDNDLGVGGEVMYSIVPSWGSDLFSINSQSGLITLDGSLDYEEVN